MRLELPSWVVRERRRIDIMAGIEQVAYKLPWENHWNVKAGRCSMCGKCCGDCEDLEKETGNNPRRLCRHGSKRPYTCCITTPRNVPECTIKFK